jgi:hypothetical protein
MKYFPYKSTTLHRFSTCNKKCKAINKSLEREKVIKLRILEKQITHKALLDTNISYELEYRKSMSKYNPNLHPSHCGDSTFKFITSSVPIPEFENKYFENKYYNYDNIKFEYLLPPYSKDSRINKVKYVKSCSYITRDKVKKYSKKSFRQIEKKYLHRWLDGLDEEYDGDYQKVITRK